MAAEHTLDQNFAGSTTAERRAIPVAPAPLTRRRVVNIEAAQVVVGAAILDATFCNLLLTRRAEALSAFHRQPCVPKGVRLSSRDVAALTAIRARNLAEFARGVEALRVLVKSPEPLSGIGDLGEIAS